MNFWQDVRFGTRMLSKDPGFTAIVVVTLGLGIGANTTVFTLVNAVLFKGLPFERPERVMRLSGKNLSKGQNRIGVCYPDFADWRARSKKFEGLAAFTFDSVTISERGNVPERYEGTRVSANTFSLIG